MGMYLESMNDMLVEVVNSTGGAKKVGCLLWPELMPDVAQRKLLDCLNPDRPAKLDPEQVLFLLRRARTRGETSPFDFLGQQLDVSFQFIQAEDKREALQIKFIAAVSEMQNMLALIQGVSK